MTGRPTMFTADVRLTLAKLPRDLSHGEIAAELRQEHGINATAGNVQRHLSRHPLPDRCAVVAAEEVVTSTRTAREMNPAARALVKRFKRTSDRGFELLLSGELTPEQVDLVEVLLDKQVQLVMVLATLESVSSSTRAAGAASD